MTVQRKQKTLEITTKSTNQKPKGKKLRLYVKKNAQRNNLCFL